MYKLLRFILILTASFAFASGLYIILNNVFFLNLKIPKENIDSFSLSSIKEIPIRLKIPSIEVDARIIPVGKTKLGAMDVPEKPEDTGWYRFGPTPGKKGSAVIAGHRGWKTGPAVFDNLHKIKINDEIYVEDEDGNKRIFVVNEIHIYKAKEQVPDVWEKDDVARLNLITCFGKWNRITGTSDERLVVFASMVN